jgi:3'-5' exoribonuclease
MEARMKDNPFQPANRLAPVAVAPAASSVTTVALKSPGNHGKGRFMVRALEVRNNARGPFLQMTLGDRAGEVTAISWKGAGLAEKVAVGTAVEIERFQVDEYGPKFEVTDVRVLATSEFRPEEFIATLPAADIEANWKEFHEFMDSLENPHLRRLKEKIWGDTAIAQKYKVHPSAVFHHHNYVGGNVQHVVGIMRVVEAVCQSYPSLDRDLAIFGAAIHDLGKLREYEVTTSIRVTDEGRMRGHLVIGAEWIAQLCQDLRREGYPFPKTVEDDLVHMILSHHGKGEWGSPKPPATPEAMLLHLGDYVDSQTKKFLQDVESNANNPEGWFKRFDPDIGENRWIRTRRDPA